MCCVDFRIWASLAKVLRTVTLTTRCERPGATMNVSEVTTSLCHNSCKMVTSLAAHTELVKKTSGRTTESQRNHDMMVLHDTEGYDYELHSERINWNENYYETDGKHAPAHVFCAKVSSLGPLLFFTSWWQKEACCFVWIQAYLEGDRYDWITSARAFAVFVPSMQIFASFDLDGKVILDSATTMSEVLAASHRGTSLFFHGHSSQPLLHRERRRQERAFSGDV